MGYWAAQAYTGALIGGLLILQLVRAVPSPDSGERWLRWAAQPSPAPLAWALLGLVVVWTSVGWGLGARAGAPGAAARATTAVMLPRRAAVDLPPAARTWLIVVPSVVVVGAGIAATAFTWSAYPLVHLAFWAVLAGAAGRQAGWPAVAVVAGLAMLSATAELLVVTFFGFDGWYANPYVPLLHALIVGGWAMFALSSVLERTSTEPLGIGLSATGTALAAAGLCLVVLTFILQSPSARPTPVLAGLAAVVFGSILVTVGRWRVRAARRA